MKGHTACDSVDGKCPEQKMGNVDLQADPQAQSGFLVVRAWGSGGGEE